LQPKRSYYEFLYFQSDWIEFYVSRGINLFLWNYPGYGKSNGSAHIKKFIDEGISVMEYVKSTYSYNKLGLHGESLGACVAIHIAQACGCDFLLADRTFSSLSDTILFNFGISSLLLI
jgi:surfactin synthase thioesterase subunit